ncbi:MAG: response regulator [Polyangiales bacterium]
MSEARLCIVAVDDDATVLQALRQQLRELRRPGLNVEVAESGEEALELLDELAAEGARVPVLIADQLMPGMKGEALLAAAHARDPDTYTLMLTGRASSDAVGAAVNTARLYRFVPKPWDHADLLLTVTGALDAWLRDREVERGKAALARAHRASLRFVPARLLELLGRARLTDARAGDRVEREVTVVFFGRPRDRGLREGRDAAAVLAWINRLVDRLDREVHERGGFIHDVAGHKVLAFFANDADAAVRTAISAQEILRELNDERGRAGGGPIRIDVGMSTGSLLLSVHGGDERLYCGALGDVINLASRVQSATRDYDARVLITGETLAALRSPKDFAVRALDDARLKGKLRPTRLIEVLDALPPSARARREQTSRDFEAAREAFEQGRVDEARQHLARVRAADPEDGPAGRLAARWDALTPREGSGGDAV